MTEKGTNPSITIFDICAQILQANSAGRVYKNSKPITDGLKPRRATIRVEGLHVLETEAILSIRVERIAAEEGGITGYQRHLSVPHARAIGRALARGRSIAPPTLALGSDGNLYATDGQHRLVAAVLAGVSLKVSVEILEESERVERFADQSLAVRPSADVLILGRVDSDLVAAYIRDAIEAERSHTEHPLAGFVGMVRADKRRLGIATAYDFLAAYALNVIGQGGQTRLIAGLTVEEARRRIAKENLDEATRLLRAFGPKQTAHPLVYAPATLRALRDIAVMGVRRSSDPVRAADRWCRIMPKFKWGGIPATATRHRDVRHELVKQWNRNLPAGFDRVDF